MATILFISHSSRDAGLARTLADVLAGAFSGVEPRLSSADIHQSGVPVGDGWRNWIHQSLREATAAIVLITPQSLRNQWLLYEAGFAAALEASRIVPLLAGVSRGDIPVPLSDLQAIAIEDVADVQSLLKQIARITGLPAPLAGGDAKWMEFAGKLSELSAETAVWGTQEIEEWSRLMGEIRNPSLCEELRSQLKAILSGEYAILGPPQVYLHDARILQSLDKNDFYYATHPFSANPGAIPGVGKGTKRDPNKGVAFQTYIKAQTAAARRGVTIMRLYSVAESDPVLKDDDFLNHVRTLEDAGIELRRSDPALFANDGISDDFVIVGDYGVGMAIPDEGPMIGSRYSLAIGSNPLYDKYFEVFRGAWNTSEPLTGRAAGSRPVSSGEPKRASRTAPPDVPTYTNPAFLLDSAVHFANRPSRRRMIVLKTGGCAYDVGKHGCAMCDFRHHAATRRVRTDELLAQLETSLRIADPQQRIEQIDLLSLGSILHDREVPRDFVHAALARFAEEESIKKVIIESRAEYVSARLLTDLRQRLRGDQILELGLGVESSDDRIRNEILNKNLPRERIFRTLDACAKAGVHFQSYLLIGTQTLAASEVVEDAVRSAFEVNEWCSDRSLPLRIAFEPVFITKNTVLEREYNAGRYRLVNLWDVVSVLRKTHHLTTVFVGMSDEQLSENRMPAGCGECTAAVRDAVEEFNATQNIDLFTAISCPNCAAA